MHIVAQTFHVLWNGAAPALYVELGSRWVWLGEIGDVSNIIGKGKAIPLDLGVGWQIQWLKKWFMSNRHFGHYYRVYDQPPQTLMNICFCFLCCIINAKLCTLKHWNNLKWDVFDIVHARQQGKDAIILPTNWNWWFLMEWGILYPKTLKLGGKTF